MASQPHALEQLKQYTTVVADTGDFQQMAQFAPQDATTNPSLILKAVQKPEYAPVLAHIARRSQGVDLAEIVNQVLVHFGVEILRIVPGRVSTEVDARLSFDTEATVSCARRLIDLYAAQGVGRDRILIKIAATWEGIEAARILEAQGIHCNVTLLFSLCQAVACAQANVRLISPFVGRIYDWAKQQMGAQWVETQYARERDPGVQSVTHIYNYYKHFDVATQVMGASFRNLGQIMALAGCDFLTISPELLRGLQSSDDVIRPQLSVAAAKAMPLQALHYNEATFRFALNEDAMATEKLAEGIRAFAADASRLDALIQGLTI